MTNGSCGQLSIASSERYSQLSLWQKTFADCLLFETDWYSEISVLTWKTKVTKSNLTLFQLVPSGRLIGGTAYGLLPTPLASGKRVIHGRMSDSLLNNYLPKRFGGIYPHPSLLEAMMGFPAGWSETEHLETP